MAFAAALPCYTIYAEVGRHILSITQGAELEANPYKEWVRTYGKCKCSECSKYSIV